VVELNSDKQLENRKMLVSGIMITESISYGISGRFNESTYLKYRILIQRACINAKNAKCSKIFKDLKLRIETASIE
jgi:enoyl-[acyl-carrier-protein] reductase (NADH)